MKLYYGLVLSFLILTGCKSTVENESNAIAEQTNITIEEYCASNVCRENHRVKFKTDNGEIDQVLPLYWPAAQTHKISILPGDKLFIEADESDGKLFNFRQVSKIENEAKTLIFSFTQMDSSLGMMLSVKNPFKKNIKYHLNMIDFSGKPHETSSCPVMAGLSVFESWGHPIPELILTDMHFANNNKNVCVY